MDGLRIKSNESVALGYQKFFEVNMNFHCYTVQVVEFTQLIQQLMHLLKVTH
jgi:hypothetical protein